MADRSIAATIAVMAVAMSLIPLGDSAAKLLIAEHGLSPYFVAWARFTLGAVLIAPFVIGQGFLASVTDWRILLRGLLITLTVAAILTALRTEPIANVFGAFFVGPILSYFLSARFLNERIGRAQTLLLFLGFAGVLLVVRPGFGMTSGLAYAVLSGCFYALYLTASRWIGHVAHPGRLLFVQVLVGAVVLLPFADIPPTTGPVPALLVLSGVSSLLGNLLLILVYRRTEASILAPFVYFQLIAATAYGLLIFGDIPDILALLGLALLICSGFGSLLLRPARSVGVN